MSWQTDWIYSRARMTPNSIAISDPDTGERWTFQEMNSRANKLAVYLQSIGVSKGDRVALLSPNDVSYFDLFFACGKLGAIFVPMNWRLAGEELEYILSDCEPRVLFYHKEVRNIIMGLKRRSLVEVTGNEYKTIMKIGFQNYEEQWVGENDPVAILYTGGTTGKPKGVVLTHQNIFYNMINTITSWSLTSSDATLTYLPMFHTGGLNALSMPVLHVGGKVIIGRKFNPEEAIQRINNEKCTVILLVPTMYHSLINSEAFQQSAFPTMHTFLSGGAPCSYTIYQAFNKKGLLFKEGYGLTEAGPNNFFLNPDSVLSKRGSVGKPMLYNQVAIMKENGTEAAEDEVGELLIKGNHVFSYYWNNEEVTKKTIVDEWLHTGDLSKKDSEGYYYIVGRKKDMIITGGENVYPLEVEHVIAEHDLVDEVAVVGLPDEKWGEVVTAFIVRKQQGTVLEEEITTFCQKKLGKYKVPKKIIFLEELPKTDVGKIDKKALRSNVEKA
ncbi:acyl-CoA synthetase [Pseudalkalibacillus caeni]|uniref:Long-chain fatty acid--CoA ligase n=1 Tax=Exobacillus caeni TaxID=2574798 RepID=A0A5R9FBK6_9BACL|nr:long-chain fatty acid--CoA ligase [Pseudalkalibacillus caeni]TLS38273.1 long-chain fatty acid--CoA ligase [Pseudalkalibacillus caeni]